MNLVLPFCQGVEAGRVLAESFGAQRERRGSILEFVDDPLLLIDAIALKYTEQQQEELLIKLLLSFKCAVRISHCIAFPSLSFVAHFHGPRDTDCPHFLFLLLLLHFEFLEPPK